jgi:hypothetical protein
MGSLNGQGIHNVGSAYKIPGYPEYQSAAHAGYWLLIAWDRIGEVED